jgi:hypothetical protein
MKVTDQTRALAQDILDYWDRFNNHDQRSWVADTDPVIRSVKIDDKKYKVCDSTLCAAGTAVFLSSTKTMFKNYAREHSSNDNFWEDKGAELLGLEYEEAYKLFYSSEDTAKRFMKAIADGDSEEYKRIVRENYYSV